MSAAIFLHLLGVTVWVGGMFFAYMALRPAAAEVLEPAQRLPLWSVTFNRFFPWVWLSIVLIYGSGIYMIGHIGIAAVPGYIWVMLGVAVMMLLIFAHVFFAPYRRLKRHSALLEWQAAGKALAQIRVLVAVNLLLGLANIGVATLGAEFYNRSSQGLAPQELAEF